MVLIAVEKSTKSLLYGASLLERSVFSIIQKKYISLLEAAQMVNFNVLGLVGSTFSP